MPKHEVYECIVKAVKNGNMKEPFSAGDFEKACPGFGIGTYRAFLYNLEQVRPPDGNRYRAPRAPRAPLPSGLNDIPSLAGP